MKKSILIFALSFMGGACVFANGNEKTTKEKLKESGEGMITNGFFFNLGFSSPSYSYTDGNFNIKDQNDFLDYTASKGPYKMGATPSIEIGNQWYFVNKEKFGVGLRVSWLQLTYSSLKAEFRPNEELKGYMATTKLVNVAPQFTYAPSEKLAFDVYVSGGLSAFGGSWAIPNQVAVGNYGIGYNYAPGIRIRYSKLALGFDYTMTTLTGSETLPHSLVDSEYSREFNYGRIYLGMQF